MLEKVQLDESVSIFYHPDLALSEHSTKPYFVQVIYGQALSTKIHAKFDAFGLPMKLILSQGQEHESQFVEAAYNSEPCQYFLADKAYDIDSFRKQLEEDGVVAVIPSKKNRVLPVDHDEDIYKERNIVERFFQKIKRYRRIATRYDKTARMYLTGIMMVSILLTIGI